MSYIVDKEKRLDKIINIRVTEKDYEEYIKLTKYYKGYTKTLRQVVIDLIQKDLIDIEKIINNQCK